MKLEFIPLSAIDFGDRARKVYENMGTFVDSVKRRDIISPIAVYDRVDRERYQPDPNDIKPRYLLLAGGRRMRAAEQLQLATIPAHVYDHELTETEMRAIELAENLHRENLTWSESVLLKKQIHDLQIATYGKKQSRVAGAPGWSQAQTAEMLGESPANLSRDLKLAETLIIVPALGSAKDKAEALKMSKKAGTDIVKKRTVTAITKKESAKGVATQQQELANNFIVRSPKEHLLESGFFEMAPKLKSGMIDIVEIDPPYGIELHKLKKTTATPASISLRGYNEIKGEIYREFLMATFTEAYRVLNNKGWLIIWFAQDPWFLVVVECLNRAGFTFRGTPAIWIKKAGQTKRPNLHLGSAYETFIYARKGDAEINKKGRINIFDFKPVPPALKVHPTERPVELMQEVLDTFGIAGARVLVPFLGSGNTLLAAANLRMNAFGYELTEEYKNDYVIRVHKSEPPNYRSYK